MTTPLTQDSGSEYSDECNSDIEEQEEEVEEVGTPPVIRTSTRKRKANRTGNPEIGSRSTEDSITSIVSGSSLVHEEEDSLASPPASKKKVTFRLQSPRIMLTYKGWLPKIDFLSWINRKKETKFARVAHEKADEEASYEHSHVLLEFKTKPNWKDPRVLDFSIDGVIVHPHIKLVSSKTHWTRCLKYLSKEDPENSDLKQKETVMTLISSAPSLQAAMEIVIEKNPENWKSAQAIKTLWEASCSRPLPNFNWKPSQPWQLEIAQWVEETPQQQDFRTIYWIFDRKGNTGKTQMAKWWMTQHPDCWLMVKDMGLSRDAASIVEGAIQRGWNSHGLVVDLPRQAERSQKRIYQWLEEVKDGVVTTTKYRGATTIFKTPHMVVFANWPPIVRALSMDRWEILEINLEGGMDPVVTEELFELQKVVEQPVLHDYDLHIEN